MAARTLNGTMSACLGSISGFLHDFNELFFPLAKELGNRQTFFMLLALYG